MTAAEKLYTETGQSIRGAEQSQMFGKPCFKVNRKAFCSLFEDEMVFKLAGKAHEEALQLKGARRFDPSGKNRPMKEWIQVPYSNKAKWPELAKAAINYVKSIS
ncbi:hypothetical protein BH09BAC3_BH09BAC3_11570 [soil metagenome]